MKPRFILVDPVDNRDLTSSANPVRLLDIAVRATMFLVKDGELDIELFEFYYAPVGGVFNVERKYNASHG